MPAEQFGGPGRRGRIGVDHRAGSDAQREEEGVAEPEGEEQLGDRVAHVLGLDLEHGAGVGLAHGLDVAVAVNGRLRPAGRARRVEPEGRRSTPSSARRPPRRRRRSPPSDPAVTPDGRASGVTTAAVIGQRRQPSHGRDLLAAARRSGPRPRRPGPGVGDEHATSSSVSIVETAPGRRRCAWPARKVAGNASSSPTTMSTRSPGLTPRARSPLAATQWPAAARRTSEGPVAAPVGDPLTRARPATWRSTSQAGGVEGRSAPSALRAGRTRSRPAWRESRWPAGPPSWPCDPGSRTGLHHRRHVVAVRLGRQPVRSARPSHSASLTSWPSGVTDRARRRPRPVG